MQKDQTDGLRGLLRSLTGALVLLAVVLLAPHAGQDHGQSFWAVARHSLWSNLGDWPATWCSVKIILFSISTFLFVQALDELILVFRRDYMSANLFLCLVIVPAVIFLIGVFYLAKALL